MRRVEYCFEIDFCEHCYEGEIEVADDVSEDEISELVKEKVFGYVSYDWKVAKDCEEDSDE